MSQDQPAREFALFRFKPGEDTAFAFGTLLLAWGAFWVGHNIDPALAGSGILRFLLGVLVLLVFYMIGTLFLPVFVPVAYMTQKRSRMLNALGIQKKGWLPALILSGALGALWYSGLVPGIRASLDLNKLLYGVFALWQAVFIFGWLQLRFDRAFGAVAGIVLATASYALLHVGSLPAGSLITLLIIGAAHALAFRITRNLLAVWPLGWALAAATLPLEVSLIGSVGQAVFFVILFALQIAAINWLWVDAQHTRKLIASPD